MAKGSGKKKNDSGPSVDDAAKKESRTRKPARTSPIKTAVHDSDLKEVSAARAFVISFVLFTIILAPVIGLGAYFIQDAEGVGGLFQNREDAFLYGMLLGMIISFIGSIVFTRKAVAQPS